MLQLMGVIRHILVVNHLDLVLFFCDALPACETSSLDRPYWNGNFTSILKFKARPAADLAFTDSLLL
mgnify:CR=1 FL=1